MQLAAGVDLTSKLTGYLNYYNFEIFQYFLSSKSTFRIYPQTGQLQFKKREKLNIHTLAL